MEVSSGILGAQPIRTAITALMEGEIEWGEGNNSVCLQALYWSWWVMESRLASCVGASNKML